MTAQAKGEFVVTLVPQTDQVVIPLFGRMTIDKVFSGDLVGASKGQMISSGTAVADSAAYVAIEKVDGLLQGRQGSFVLQHNATMDKGDGMLNVIVVPDSGTGELLGLSGKLMIIRKDGKHLYEFDYSLPGE